MGAKRDTGVLGGFVCGLLATASMSGFAAMVQRTRRPTEGKRLQHYERVGERLVEIAPGGPAELDEATRVRLGEGLHFLFGGVMGAVFVTVTERVPIPDPLKGSAHGLVLWGLGFGGYFPALGIKEGVWHWGAEEVARTLGSHLVYGNSLMLLARGWPRTRS